MNPNDGLYTESRVVHAKFYRLTTYGIVDTQLTVLSDCHLHATSESLYF